MHMLHIATVAYSRLKTPWTEDAQRKRDSIRRNVMERSRTTVDHG